MAQLSMNDFATPAQLAAFCNVQMPAISKATKQLQSQSMIVTEADFRPAVLRLSFKGARMMGKVLSSGKRSPSAAVQQHACHRNEAALILSKKYSGFQWTPKKQLLAMAYARHWVNMRPRIIVVVRILFCLMIIKWRQIGFFAAGRGDIHPIPTTILFIMDSGGVIWPITLSLPRPVSNKRIDINGG